MLQGCISAGTVDCGLSLLHPLTWWHDLHSLHVLPLLTGLPHLTLGPLCTLWASGLTFCHSEECKPWNTFDRVSYRQTYILQTKLLHQHLCTLQSHSHISVLEVSIIPPFNSQKQAVLRTLLCRTEGLSSSGVCCAQEVRQCHRPSRAMGAPRGSYRSTPAHSLIWGLHVTIRLVDLWLSLTLLDCLSPFVGC